jgi:aspartyl-tRNA(Asn)/glutamyl-tRNA(Gln) amidotransferase subunit A
MLDLSLAALVEAFRRKAFTPLDYWDALERHIQAWEPHIKALYLYDPAAARLEAQASAQRWAKGEPAGPLDGVPVTIKELIATKGAPIPQGSAAIPLVPAAEDAPPAARLREAGAILFAKTTVPDLAMLSSGLSTFHGITRNPWNLSRNPGGSSAGAGAAGAAGYGPLHIGTDIGGSIRLPAGWCGLVGFKPSLGRVPIDPYYVGRAAGPMTRTVEDAALAMGVLARPDSRDAMSLPSEKIDWTALETKVKGLRIRRRAALRGGRRHRRAGRAGADPRDSRRYQPVLAGARLERDPCFAAGPAGSIAALHLRVGQGRRGGDGLAGGRRVQPDSGDQEARRRAVRRARRGAVAD